MKSLIVILSLFVSTQLIGQRKYVFGIVKDSANQEVIIGAHIRNLTSGSLAISDAYGKFRIPVEIGDTLSLSHVGYKHLGWIAKESWFDQDRVSFALPVDEVYLEEVVIGEFPEYQRFKQIIVDTKPLDTSFWYHGVPQVEMEEYTVMEKKEFNNPLFIATHPISFLHHAISKKEKEKRKMQQIQKSRHIVGKAQTKFRRDWVSEMTSLEGDDLTNFIAYCKFTPEYIAKTPLYIIHEKMMTLLDDFLDEQVKG